MVSLLLFFVLLRVFKIHFFLGILSLVFAYYIYEAFSMNALFFVELLGLENYFRVQTIETGSGRYIAWNFAWGEIDKYYLMGGGFGQDEQVMRPNYQWLARLNHQGGLHNSYLSLWFDSGFQSWFTLWQCNNRGNRGSQKRDRLFRRCHQYHLTYSGSV